MKPYPIVVATRCTRSQGGSDRERKCLRSWWRNWRGACVARALKCVSILNVPTEPAKPNKCQWARAHARAQVYNEKSTQRQSLPVFTLLPRYHSPALSLTLCLCVALCSQLIWDLCERRSARTVWLISSLSSISFSFSICVEKFIHALLLCECACCLMCL